MQAVRIFCLLVLSLGTLLGFLTEGPSGAVIGFLLASIPCVTIYYVARAIASNRISAESMPDYGG